MIRNTMISAMAAVVALPVVASAADTAEYDCLISLRLSRGLYDNRTSTMTKVEPPVLQRIRVTLGYGVGYIDYHWEGRNVLVPIAIAADDGASGINFGADATHQVTFQWKWNGKSYVVYSVNIHIDYPDKTTSAAFGMCVPRVKG
jgi:hypothetical protein